MIGDSARRLRDSAVILGAFLFGAYYSLGVIWRRASLGQGLPSYDIYAYFYPNTLYALRALTQGHGLLWNSLQNCGQPFFANPQTALLYPPLLIFLVAPVDAGLLVISTLHLAIGGIGTYYLCRELQLSRFAAVCGAVTFEFGGNALSLASWMPIISGAYAWMPVAVFLCERTLRRSSFASALLLALTLTVQLLAGYPQVSFFTYELIALRALWAFASRESHIRAVALVALGLVSAPLLAAIHLLPGLEFAGQSVRNSALSQTETNVLSASWQGFRTLVARRLTGPGTTFNLIPATLAGLALFPPRRKSTALFYVLATAFNLALAFDNPISALYRASPVGAMFRGPDRFLWPTALCFSVVVAFGAETLNAAHADSRLRFALNAVGVAVGALAFYLLSPPGLFFGEWIALTCVAVALLAYRAPFSVARFAPVGVFIVLVANLVAFAGTTTLSSIKDAEAVMRTHDRVFDYVSARSTLTDRTHQLGRHADYSLMPKSSSVFGTRGINDYEPMTSRRYAEYYVKLVTGSETHVWMESLNQFYFLHPQFPRNRGLLNLSAARFIVVDPEQTDTSTLPNDGFELLTNDGPIHVYENTQALPRAFFVPQATAFPGPRALLNRLSLPNHDPMLVAFLDVPPDDGFTGTPGTFGRAEIVKDESEELVVKTIASSDGFLFVADQYFPGWYATVNKQPASIMRANYAFRLVRVPSGESEIVFRYRPQSVQMGVAISAITALTLGIAFLVHTARRKRSAAERP